MNPKDNKRYNTLQPLILAACIAVGMMVGYKINDQPDGRAWQWIENKEGQLGEGRIEQLLRFIEHKYVENIDDDLLTEEAVRAILLRLDPYSAYLTPEEAKGVNEDMNGAYVGIGVENYFLNDTVQVSKVLPESPAFIAGLKVHDKLLFINDVSVAGQGLEYTEIKDMLSRQIGEKITLKILRNSQPITIDIVVNHISLSTIQAYPLPEVEAAYIKIKKFGAHTYKEFMEEVEVLFGEKNAQHLILDLRDNPGGYLPEAIHILCQIFEEKNKLLLYTEGKNNKKNEYKSTGKRFFNIQNVVVLIDENSASASEIIAGAIQDWDRGIVIGRRSYGKGMVQEQYPLNNGGAIRLTVAKYFTPSGRCIQRDFIDRELFENEVSMRYKSGEMFYPDSLAKTNSDTFYTKIHQRPLYSEGGISPDIFIPLPSFLNEPESFRIRYLIPEFLYHHIINLKNDIPTTAEQLIAWKMPRSYYSEFIGYSEDFYQEYLYWPQIYNYEPLFIDELAQQTLNEKELWKYMLKEDKALIEAIDVLKKKLKPANLIKTK